MPSPVMSVVAGRREGTRRALGRLLCLIGLTVLGCTPKSSIRAHAVEQHGMPTAAVCVDAHPPADADPCAGGPPDAAGPIGHRTCVPTEAGNAWVLRVVATAGDRATWQITHVRAGRPSHPLVLSAFAPPHEPSAGGARPTSFEAPFDYDGDGLRDLVFIQGPGTYDAGFEGAVILAGDPPRIAYRPPPRFFLRDVSDVDGDGRPDLLLVLMTGGDHDVGCGAYGPATWSPEFVAHSLRGGAFAIDDAVALSHVRTWCSAEPKSTDTTDDLLCALLFGSHRAEIRRRLAADLDRCVGAARRDASEGCTADFCDEERDRKALGEWTPPLKLLW